MNLSEDFHKEVHKIITEESKQDELFTKTIKRHNIFSLMRFNVALVLSALLGTASHYIESPISASIAIFMLTFWVFNSIFLNYQNDKVESIVSDYESRLHNHRTARYKALLQKEIDAYEENFLKEETSDRG